MHYGPLSYHSPGRVYPRSRLRAPYACPPRLNRRLSLLLAADATVAEAEQGFVYLTSGRATDTFTAARRVETHTAARLANTLSGARLP